MWYCSIAVFYFVNIPQHLHSTVRDIWVVYTFAAVNILVLFFPSEHAFLLCIYLRIESLGCGYGYMVCSFLVDSTKVFKSGFTDSHSHQQCMRVPFVSHLRQYLVLSVFIFSYSGSVCSGIALYFNFIFLVTNEVEHLFICGTPCLLAIWISAFVKY